MIEPRPGTAVVLVNLGTPRAPTSRAVRPYLREFLTDRRVVDMHPAVWRPILELGVLSARPRASAAKYRTVWTPDGSPLLVHTRAQAAALQATLGADVEVAVAMRYGQPAFATVLADLVDRGHERVLVVPLYPQYASSSTGTVLDAAHRAVAALPHHPEVRTVRAFGEHPAYVDAVCTALEERWHQVGRPDPASGDRVVLSFHGIPQAMSDAGDPYLAECERTADAVRQRLGLDAGSCLLTFQSRFGPARWLGPATIDTVRGLGADGSRRTEVVCPGFVSDCLETLEEIDQLNREAYEEAGGSGFAYVPWGNARPAWTDALGQIVRTHLDGWVPVGAGR
ncbi:ferrochelatase [Cellulomonas sp. P22]|uniref:ferrochelatase n=1 Tax=Cellulomonas sp. P22 TaxID=3373189 RepID=UPI003791E792